MAIYQCDTLVVERDRDGSVFLKIDVPGKTQNVFDRDLLFDLDVALDHIRAEERTPLVVVRSGKSAGFVAGADLQDLAALPDAAAAEQMSKTGQDLFDKLAALTMPTVAMISGPCLGGGLEFALACDYRLVYDKPTTQLGFPEVRLGLIPAWGGTQRLPRVVGLENALQMILAEKRLSAREAFQWGLADAWAASETELRERFVRLSARAVAEGKKRPANFPVRTWRQRLLETTAPGRRLLFRGAERLLARKTPDDMPAPAEALEAIRVGAQSGMREGLSFERAAVGRLATSPASRNLIGLFLAGERAKKLPARASAEKPVRRVGVVGAGVMGAGIAQLALLKGCEVRVQETNAETLGLGVSRITQLLENAVARGLLARGELARRLASLKGTTTWDGFGDLDLVVEAAVENLAVKQALFRELSLRTRPTTVLATNTSSFSVASLQEYVDRPERVAGLHFFNPVHKMPLVEVARSPATGDDAITLLIGWAATLGKTPIAVKDSPGYVVNRLLVPYLNEAVLLVGEGLKVDDLDAVMRKFGMVNGPLETLDQVGLDVAADVAQSLSPLFSGRIAANPAFAAMKGNGWLGRKSGRGFYDYRGRRPSPNRLAENLVRADAPPSPDKALPKAVRLSEARDRMVLIAVNEAARVWEAGLAADAATVDLALVLGAGWAPHRGGPLRYADQRGIGDVVQRLTDLAARHGPRFDPCDELKKRATRPEPFTGVLPLATRS